jgi:hypothetical protein
LGNEGDFEPAEAVVVTPSTVLGARLRRGWLGRDGSVAACACCDGMRLEGVESRMISGRGRCLDLRVGVRSRGAGVERWLGGLDNRVSTRRHEAPARFGDGEFVLRLVHAG